MDVWLFYSSVLFVGTGDWRDESVNGQNTRAGQTLEKIRGARSGEKSRTENTGLGVAIYTGMLCSWESCR